MEPTPETSEALEELARRDDDGDLLARMLQIGRQVEDLVPDVMGMSLSVLQHGVTFTLVASDETIALLDALQYMGGGPCVRAVTEQDVLTTDRESMNEEGWHTFADATAAKGVASTLSMPVLENGEVIGGVNLYGGSRRAFDGHHEQLAQIVGAWAGGAIRNADLSFSTREAARRAPGVLRDARALDTACGILTASFGWPIDEARARLERAAARAGIEPARGATIITELLGPQPGRA